MSKHKLGVKTSGDHVKVTPSCGNVFADLGFTAEDYAAKLTEIDTLRRDLSRYREACGNLMLDASELREKIATLESIIAKQLY